MSLRSHLLAFIAFFLCLLGSTSQLLLAEIAPTENINAGAYAKKIHPRILAASFPLQFEPNQGQADRNYSYITHSGGLLLEFAPRNIAIHLPRHSKGESLNVSFTNASRDTSISSSEMGTGESNYLIGRSPSNWHTHIPQYGRITYNNIYPGVNVAFYGNGQKVEHDFLVQPGADYRRITMRYEGSTALTLSHNGDLHVGLEQGEIVVQAPHIYQVKDGRREERQGGFVLLSKNEVGFEILSFDHALPLVIDPVLDYSTYLADVTLGVAGVAVDSGGNTYVTGEVEGSGYPVTTGANNCNSCSSDYPDVFITKLNPAGTAQVYSTVIGGTQMDQAHQIAVDSNGNAIITVYSWSYDFPVQNSISSGSPSGSDGFIVSLAPDGASLNFSSRLGGRDTNANAGPTYPNGLALDAHNNIYVTGTTGSPYLPVTAGALHAVNVSYNQTGVFVTKLSSSGSLGFSAIVGDSGQGSGLIGPVGLALDSAGAIYIAGNAGTTVGTNTAPWPTTGGAYQATTPNTAGGPFVTKIAADGSSILWSTLLDPGILNAMSLTSNNEVILVGTYGQIPVTPDAFDSSPATSFITKVSSDGTQVLYSSNFGIPTVSGSVAVITNTAVDNNGDVWVGGYTDLSLNVPMVNPLQSVPAHLDNFSRSAFVSEFDPQLHSLLFSTFFNGVARGGSVNGIAFDPQNKAHIVGISRGDLPTTSSSYLPFIPTPSEVGNYNDANRGFVALIDTTTPGPGICFSPSFDLGMTAQVGTTKQSSITVTNCGNATLNIASTVLTGSSFSMSPSANCVGQISAGQSCTIGISFTPTAAGSSGAAVAISSDAVVPTYNVSISGTGTAPKLSFPIPASFPDQVFGDPASGANFVAIVENIGTAPLVIQPGSSTITGDFKIVSNSCTSPVRPNAFCTFTLVFQPTAVGIRTGTLAVSSNDPIQPMASLSLLGNALAAYPVPTITRLTQPSVALGSAATTLNVFGTNFFPNSYIVINGQSYSTTYLNSVALSATIDPTTLTATGELPVTVVNPAPGNQSAAALLSVYRSLPIPAASLVYDPVSAMLYASIPATAASNPNTILPIDPTTGQSGTPIPVGNNPNKLALSDDGKYLFVGANGDHALQRINLKTQQVERTFPLPLGTVFSLPTTVSDMHVVPGSPQSVVATLFSTPSPPEAGIILANDSGIVSYAQYTYPTYFALDNFSFTSDPSTIYGYPFGGAFFSTAGVSATGVTPINSNLNNCCSQTTGSTVASDGTLLYTNSGQVWNPRTQTLQGTYQSGSNVGLDYEPSVLPDTGIKRTFFLDTFQGYNDTAGYTDILSFDQTSYQQVDAVYIHTSGLYGGANLLRWGANGFAFLTGNQVVILTSRLAQPSSSTAPVLSSLSPSSAPLGSAALTLTVNGTGFIPGSVVAWNGISRQTTYISSSQLTTQISANDLSQAGTAQVTVVNASPGGSSAPMTFTIAGASLTLSTTALNFNAQQIGVSSSTLPINLTNSGGLALSNLSIALTNPGDTSFSQTNTCGTSLAVGANCTITVVFTPVSIGGKGAAIGISANGLNPQNVSLTGTGATASVSLSTTTPLQFGTQTIGVATSPKTITVTNAGTIPATGVAISIAGTNASDFGQSNTCGTTLAAGANCTVNVSFTASIAMAEQATLTFAGSNISTLALGLNGTGAVHDFSLTTPNGSTTVTTQSGQPAMYSLSLTSAPEFTGTASLSCANLPLYASCNFSPSAINLSAGATTPFTLTISTQQISHANLLIKGPAIFSLAMLALPPILWSSRRKNPVCPKKLRFFGLLLALACTGLVVLSGCGGASPSSSSSGQTTPLNTPAGTYNISVTATSGTVSRSTIVSLVVK